MKVMFLKRLTSVQGTLFSCFPVINGFWQAEKLVQGHRQVAGEGGELVSN